MFLVFILHALCAGLAIALMAGPLGCFVVWRRMAYFGDTLAHCALLGLVFGVYIGMNTQLAMLMVALSVALGQRCLQQKQLANDTLLGIISHSALALGIVLIALVDDLRGALFGYLFGDILAISPIDLLIIIVGSIIVLAVLWRFWRDFVALIVHEDLAQVEGRPVLFLNLLLMILIATVVALSMKAVGVLLITALLIIPAASARQFACSPTQMAILASAFGCAAVILGLVSSLLIDSPTGPSIVVAASSLFVMSRLVPVITHAITVSRMRRADK